MLAILLVNSLTIPILLSIFLLFAALILTIAALVRNSVQYLSVAVLLVIVELIVLLIPKG